MACCALLQQGSGSVTRLDLGSNEVAAQNPSKASVIHQGLSHALTGMSTLEELILSRFSCASEHRSCWIQTLEALQTPLTQSLLVLSVRGCFTVIVSVNLSLCSCYIMYFSCPLSFVVFFVDFFCVCWRGVSTTLWDFFFLWCDAGAGMIVVCFSVCVCRG